MRRIVGLLLCTSVGHAGGEAPGLPHEDEAGQRDALDLSNNRTSHFVLLYPPKKLAFCYIPKNACAQFNHLFDALNEQPQKLNVLQASSVSAMGYSMEDVSQKKGWKWAVFLRDPLVRYLSAWGNKCYEEFQKGHTGGSCLHQMISKNASVSDFEQHVLASAKDPRSINCEPHWEQQQRACGGLNNATGYDFVGHLRGDVNSQVKAMLRMVDAPRKDVDYFFPKHKVAGHHNLLKPSEYYRNSTIRAAVMKLYKEDYVLPGLAHHGPR